jgi:hypothetical protein
VVSYPRLLCFFGRALRSENFELGCELKVPS